jgi:diguanylate cyclase (GGDEF)-like protein
LVALGLGSACWLWKKNCLGARSLSLAWVLLAIILGVEKLSWTTEINLAEQWIFNAIVAFLGWLTLTFLFVESQTRRIQESKAFNDLEEKNQALQDILNAREERPDATEELEFQVQERTLELEIALRELSEKNQELEEKNTLDALTNIRNRSYFDKKYLAELRRSRREQTSLSVAMLDIDHFKAVNDEYGHLAGDECIKAVATIIQQALKRPSDDVCRYGGEEFALILPNTDISGAVNLVEQIREQIAANKIRVDDLEIQITASIGVASSIVTLTQNEEALIALADKQLYQAKAAGRNQVLASQLDSQ